MSEIQNQKQKKVVELIENRIYTARVKARLREALLSELPEQLSPATDGLLSEMVGIRYAGLTAHQALGVSIECYRGEAEMWEAFWDDMKPDTMSIDALDCLIDLLDRGKPPSIGSKA